MYFSLCHKFIIVSARFEMYVSISRSFSSFDYYNENRFKFRSLSNLYRLIMCFENGSRSSKHHPDTGVCRIPGDRIKRFRKGARILDLPDSAGSVLRIVLFGFEMSVGETFTNYAFRKMSAGTTVDRAPGGWKMISRQRRKQLRTERRHGQRRRRRVCHFDVGEPQVPNELTYPYRPRNFQSLCRAIDPGAPSSSRPFPAGLVTIYRRRRQ